VWKGKHLVVRYEGGAPRNQRVNTMAHPSTHSTDSGSRSNSRNNGSLGRTEQSRSTTSSGGTGLFVGTLTSAKTEKSAVKRNRMRRRCREALRRETKEKSALPTMQLLLMPRRSSLTCDFAEIVSDVQEFLSSVS